MNLSYHDIIEDEKINSLKEEKLLFADMGDNNHLFIRVNKQNRSSWVKAFDESGNIIFDEFPATEQVFNKAKKQCRGWFNTGKKINWKIATLSEVKHLLPTRLKY